MSQTRRRMLWGGILALALVVRIGAAVYWQSRLPEGEAFAFPDSESYWALGERIAQRDTYQFAESRAFRTPGYPALLAPLFLIFDDPPVLLARMAGAVLGVVVVAGVGTLAWMLFDERTGLVAALLCALYPGAIAMSILVLSEALFCPLMVGQVVLWIWVARGQGREAKGEGKTLGRWRMYQLAAAAGVLAALAILTRPSWLLFTPFAVVIAVAFFPPRLRQLRIGATMLCAMALTMSPWWIRNAAVLNAFVPTTTQVGASLYDGLHEGATGASEMSFVPQVESEYLQGKPRLGHEVALNRHFASEAISWAKSNPLAVGRLAVVKFTRIWNIWPNEGSLRSWPLRLIVAVGYLPILIAALFGIGKFTRRGWPYVICWLPAIYFTLLHMVFVGSIRYRQPAMLLLIVLAAGFVVSCANRGFRRRLETN